MKEIVPYTDDEKKVIDGTVKEDVSDSIFPVRNPAATFVVAQAMKLDDDEGWYTGWWFGGKADGRGTWRRKDGKTRFDATWKNGVEHGTGRWMRSETEGIYGEAIQEGKYENGSYADGVKRYHLSTGSKVYAIWNKQQKKWKQQ